MYKYVLEVAKQNLSPSAPPEIQSRFLSYLILISKKYFQENNFFYKLIKIINKKLNGGSMPALGFFIFKP